MNSYKTKSYRENWEKSLTFFSVTTQDVLKSVRQLVLLKIISIVEAFQIIAAVF